ncbi:ABC transporter ATP-binding protein [Oscillospiraceae bacterium MB08-C2-2]|nr:ABC transporter ATP-binding protein [Oscillospiraceae bacterium MB08-C2-2]
MALLKVENIAKSFGGVNAVVDFSMEMDKGEVVGIIGPNGAGKTTIFNLISKVYTPDQGKLWLDGEEISGFTQEQAARRGIGRTFQNIRLFSGLSVLDNVKVSCDYKPRYSMAEAVFSLPRCAKGNKETTREAMECLCSVGMEKYAYDRPSNLPYGLQRRLEIARALALRPKVLMLDEPAAGLNPEECLNMVDFLREIIEKFGLALLIIEHRMDVVMNLCDKIYVQDFGKNIASGTPLEIQCNPKVLAAYLGEED